MLLSRLAPGNQDSRLFRSRDTIKCPFKNSSEAHAPPCRNHTCNKAAKTVSIVHRLGLVLDVKANGFCFIVIDHGTV
jgi:hypothetical protein